VTFPGPLRLPARADPVGNPGAGLSDDVARTLLTRRVVLVHGAIDDGLAAETAATLMMLDATGDGRILVRLTGADASIEVGLVLMDVVAVLGVPVDVAAAGTISGGAVGLLAVGRHRTLAGHATIHLREPDGTVAGRAADIERALAAQAARRDQFFARIAECTGRPHEVVRECWGAARYLGPADAVALGYADDIEERAGR
jgi:ATP-dependent Clp protease, protease subunit